MGRKVDLDDLIDVGEVAELLGLKHKNSVTTYMRRYDDFPAPAIEFADGKCRAWLRYEVSSWVKARKDRSGEVSISAAVDFSLAEFLAAKKPVLVLGAGASMDYGFPSWIQLQAMLLREIRLSTPDSAWLTGLEYTAEDLSALENLVENATGNTTIDKQIEANLESHRHIERAFRRLSALVLVRSENEDIQEDCRGWVEELADGIVGLVASAKDKKQFLREHRTPSIVTFNYDRAFEYHFFSDIEERLEAVVGETNWERAGSKFLQKSVVHPHGAIGSGPIDTRLVRVSANGYANLSSNRGVTYGSQDGVVASWRSQPKSPFVYTVDAFEDRDVARPSYDAAQKLLRGADVLMIGLSLDGQRNQKLDFSVSKSIRVNNGLSEYEDVGLKPRQIFGAEVECLAMRAGPLVRAIV